MKLNFESKWVRRKTWFFRVLHFLAGFLLVLWVCWVWFSWAKWGAPIALNLFCPTRSECEYLGQVGDLFGGVNAIFAGFAFAGLLVSLEASRRQNAKQWRWGKDKELVDQICSSYHWAYDSIAAVSDVSMDFMSIRRGWLVAARHLLRAEKLVKDIQTDVFRTIQQEQAEMWRTRLHSLTSDAESLPFRATVQLQPAIELRSAMVVAVFLADGGEWKDPIDEIDAHQLFESDSWGGSFLSRFIEKHVARVHPEFVEEHIQRYPDGRIAQQRHRFASTVEDTYRQTYAHSSATDGDQENQNQPQT